MAYLYLIGSEAGSFHSKAVHVHRRGQMVTQEWGAVTVVGAAAKSLCWAPGYPMHLNRTFKTIDGAARYQHELINRKIRKGYRRLTTGHVVRRGSRTVRPGRAHPRRKGN